MRSLQAPVVARLEATPGVWQIHVRSPQLARNASPGRFVMALRSPTLDPYLRVSLPIHRIGEETVAFLLDERDPEQRALSQATVGEPLDLMGPLGKGYALSPSSTRLLLVAQGLGIAPLIGLAESAITQGRQVALLALAEEPSQFYPASLLASEIEYHTMLADGATDPALQGVLKDLVPWADSIGAAGPLGLYRLLREWLAADPIRDRPGRCQVYLSTKMACGLGLCHACAIKVRRGIRHVCTDGPVFDLAILDI